MATVASEAPEPSMAYRLQASELLAQLGTDERTGLSNEEARARLAQYGSNELSAEKRAMSAADASAIRAGERRSIPAAEIAPGDIILIEEGDTIPADGRLLESAALQTAEAALTGESLPEDRRALSNAMVGFSELFPATPGRGYYRGASD